MALDAALGNKLVKAGASGSMVARIGLATRTRSATARPPVNLALLVDTSGSMEGKAIADARAASLALVASLCLLLGACAVAGDDSKVVVLTDANFEALTSEGSWLLEFYAPVRQGRGLERCFLLETG